VAARDGADALGGTDEGETEGDGDAEDADFVASNNGSAATEEHQDEGADEFSEVLFH
jgi:hypothetical protein